ncbi:hypothetical protein ACFL2T_01215 [Elusimicrobiota bacterium]
MPSRPLTLAALCVALGIVGVMAGTGVQAEQGDVAESIAPVFISSYPIPAYTYPLSFHPNGRPTTEIKMTRARTDGGPYKSLIYTPTEMRFLDESGKPKETYKKPGITRYSENREFILHMMPTKRDPSGTVLAGDFSLIDGNLRILWTTNKLPTVEPRTITVSNLGAVVASDLSGSTIWVNGKQITSTLPQMQAQWSRDGKYFLSIGGYGKRNPARSFLVVRLYDDSGKMLWERDMGSRVHLMANAISSHGNFIGLKYMIKQYRGIEDGFSVKEMVLEVIDRKGVTVDKLQLDHGGSLLEFSPNEKFLVAQLSDRLNSLRIGDGKFGWHHDLNGRHPFTLDIRDDGGRLLLGTRNLTKPRFKGDAPRDDAAPRDWTIEVLDSKGKTLRHWTMSGELLGAQFMEPGGRVLIQMSDRVEVFEEP